MSQEKIQVGARIPKTLFDICSQRYQSMTTAIIAGLELLVKQDDNSCYTKDNKNENVCQIDDNNYYTNDNSQLIHELRIRLEEKDKYIETLKTELKKAPDPIEFAQLRTKSEDLENHNQTLKADLNQAHQDKETIQNLYDNYMRQMQTLIQQKAIEAPGEKKRWWKFW